MRNNTTTAPWHENDAFWIVRDQFMFGPQAREQAIADVGRVLDLLQLPPQAAVLDLCCGPGRHCIELTKRGYAVTAVDRTRHYVDQARRLAADAAVDIEFVEDDMRHFCRPHRFDGAVNLFTSFGYFEDPAEDRKVLVNLHRSLKPGGRLVMDMAGKEILARTFQRHAWQELDGVLLLSERSVEHDWSWMRTREIYVHDGRREEHTFEHRLYSGAELRALLSDVGFADVQIFGSLDGVPYDQHARRLVAVARK